MGFSQRIYSTNLAYEPTVTSPRLGEVCKSFDPGAKGQATFYLKAYPNRRVQITRGGFVKILYGTKKDDERILKIIANYVVTTDEQKFRWFFQPNKSSKSEEELLIEDIDRQIGELTYAIDTHLGLTEPDLTPEEEEAQTKAAEEFDIVREIDDLKAERNRLIQQKKVLLAKKRSRARKIKRLD